MISKTSNKVDRESARKAKAFKNLLAMLIEFELAFKLSPELDNRQVKAIKRKMLQIFNY